ncbi:hypothetical protein imdm_690 [gamma proteobacterium IMCC2047]|nr:hypothetical protein imdm_690 [gamma proteobacterium IMCC2047]
MAIIFERLLVKTHTKPLLPFNSVKSAAKSQQSMTFAHCFS